MIHGQGHGHRQGTRTDVDLIRDDTDTSFRTSRRVFIKGPPYGINTYRVVSLIDFSRVRFVCERRIEILNREREREGRDPQRGNISARNTYTDDDERDEIIWTSRASLTYTSSYWFQRKG